MTDKPNTLALNARQWRVLMNDHLEVLKAVVASTETLSEDGLKNVMRHMDEVRLMAGAWFQNSPAPAAASDQDASNAMAEHSNGAEPKKRRGGWPAGKPRKPRSPSAAVQ